MSARGKRPGMKWYWKLLLTVCALTMALYIAGMIYAVRAKLAMNDYIIQLSMAFNAATMVNAKETYTDPDRAIIAEYGGERCVVVPENYRQLSGYLTWNHAMPPFGSVDEEEALHVSICGGSDLYIEGDEDGQGAMVLFESAGKRFTMHIASVDLWDKILKACMEGSYKAENIPL